MIIDDKSNIKHWQQGLDFDAAKKCLEEQAKSRIHFGIKFLDDVFHGIVSTDIILCGAKTGAGKTELVSNIAVSAIEQGKRVAMFALEAEQHEVTMRILYRECAKIYYSLPLENRRQFNYVDWCEGMFDEILAPHLEGAKARLAEKFKPLHVRYKSEEIFTTEHLKKEIGNIENHADLIILDHIHYVDLVDTNENRAMSELVQVIRDMGLVTNTPIIVVAHVRKGDTKNRAVVPDIEDFHGSSNLSKICTKAFMLAPANDYAERDTTKYPTYIRICKFRKDGSRALFTGVVNFDISLNRYREKYFLGRLVWKKNVLEFAPIGAKSQLPLWAESAEVFITPEEKQLDVDTIS